MSTATLTDADGVVRFRGAVSGAVRILDFGLLNLLDLNSGPVTIYTPAAGDFVALTLSADGYVEHDFDNGNGDVAIGQNPDFTNSNYMLGLPIQPAKDVQDDISLGVKRLGVAASSLVFCFMETDDPIIAQAFDGNGDPVIGPNGAPGLPATQGAIHLLAFVATPAAP